MKVIEFVEAKKDVLNRRYRQQELVSALKIRGMSNELLYDEYKLYRVTLDEADVANKENADSMSLIYLCEVMMEVAHRGLVEDFCRRFETNLRVV